MKRKEKGNAIQNWRSIILKSFDEDINIRYIARQMTNSSLNVYECMFVHNIY